MADLVPVPDPDPPGPPRRLRPLLATGKEVIATAPAGKGDEVVGPLVVRGERLVVIGRKGHGKSTFLSCLAAAAIHGGRFLGWEAHGGARVLILDGEQDRRTLGRLIPTYRLEDAIYLPFNGVGMDLTERRDQVELDGIVGDLKPDVLILDPLYRAHAADTNRPVEAARLSHFLDALRYRHRCALVVGAHAKKGRGAPGVEDVSGAGELVYGAEVVIALERARQGRSFLTVRADRVGDVGLALDERQGLRFHRGRGFTIDPLHHAPVAKKDVLAVLAAAGVAGSTIQALAAECDVTARTVRRALDLAGAVNTGRRDTHNRVIWRAAAHDLGSPTTEEDDLDG